MKTLVLAIIGISISSLSLADCRPAYHEAVEIVQSGHDAAKAGAMGAAAVAVIAVSPVGKLTKITNALMNSRIYWGALGGVVIGGATFRIDEDVVKVKSLIDQSYLGVGPELTEVANTFKVTNTQAAKMVVILNESNAFCPTDRYGRALSLADIEKARHLIDGLAQGPVSP